ncbi:DUF4982 domain-containing protein [Streptococcus mitis]|uniref:sugar-binding domain-containing protein n=1 Tax=Streptococcus mitis TaxID=28037 RepID=UPI0039C26E9E
MRREEVLRNHWFFSQEVGKEEALASDFQRENWQAIQVPHDWSIYNDFDQYSPAQNEGGQLNGGQAWYRTQFYLEEDASLVSVRLLFDGVYMNAQVYINGQVLGYYPNGYTPFSYDITPYLRNDGTANHLAIFVENQQPSSRWYSGSGIYREVKLLITDAVHLDLYGITIASPKLKEQRDGWVETQLESKVSNDGPQSVSVYLEQSIWYDGQQLSDWQATDSLVIESGEKHHFQQAISIFQPLLWDIDHPHLYQLKTRIYKNGILVDEGEESFGYRYMDWQADKGFFLNGRWLKIHGVCLHHDYGALGAVENRSAAERRLRQMQEMGVNAIRITHNPASSILLDVAAKVGLLIQEEAFDTWYGGKKEYDYSRFFEEEATHPEAKAGDFWSDYDLCTMLQRGKNNPAIFMWSLGNEVSEANGDAHSLKTIKRLLGRVKEVDDSRFVTMGMDQFRFGDGSGGHEKIADLLDVVGLNYSEDNIDAIRKRHPKWRLYGSETSSATRTRDSYFRPDKEWVGDNRRVRNFEQSDYGNDRVPWGKTATASWITDRNRLDYAGQFIWTGVDYIGEPTPWHNQNDTPVKSSYFGIVDTAGIPKNDYYLYQSQWVDLDQHSMVHILPHWNWEIHKSYQQVVDKYGDIPVRVYSNAGSVELFLNGKSQGLKTFQEKWTSDGRKYQEGEGYAQLYLEWRLAYQPGELYAVAYDRQGQIVAEDRVVTAGESAKIGLHAEKTQLEPDGQDLLYLYFDVLDKDGNWVPSASNQLHFEMEGPARIVGVDNGRQASRERYQAQKNGRFKRKAFHGRGVLLVQSLEQVGQVRVKASARGLEPASFDLLVGEAFDCQPVKNQRLFEIRVDKQAELQEGDSPAIGLYPQTVDNPVNKVGNSEVIWETSGSAHAIIKQGVLHCLSAGDLAIRAIYQGKTYQMHLQVAENTSLGQAVSVRPLCLYTDKGTYPQLPSSVLVDYESGSAKRVKVVWEAISEEDLASFHKFTVSGQLEGLDLKACAQVCVQGICVLEPEKVWTLVKEAPHLPDRVKLVLSDGRRDTAKVTWDELDPQVYAQVGECVLTGQVAGCELTATVTIHVTDASVDGEVISNQWTGSNLPLVFASHSEPNHPASYLNDKVIAQKKSTANTWIAKSEQASVGILFGDAGILKPRFVDNLTLYYVENQEYAAVEPTFIDYYIGNEPSLPRTPNHLDKDSALKQEKNWRPVSGIRKVSSDKDEEIRFEFDKVETYALRLRFENLASPLALTELQVYAKKVKKNVDRK